MPGTDGLAGCAPWRWQYRPALVFVTAHAEHAVTAFELDAVDYLTKPVRFWSERALPQARRQK